MAPGPCSYTFHCPTGVKVIVESPGTRKANRFAASVVRSIGQELGEPEVKALIDPIAPGIAEPEIAHPRRAA